MMITEALVVEHAVFGALFDQVERMLPDLGGLAEVRLVGSLVEGLLRRHAATEEDLVLLALDDVREHRRHCDRFHQQHQEIDARLKQAQSVNRIAAARSLLQAAFRTSRAHFRTEEKTIFPLLELVVTRQKLAQWGRAWRQPRPPAARVPARHRSVHHAHSGGLTARDFHTPRI